MEWEDDMNGKVLIRIAALAIVATFLSSSAVRAQLSEEKKAVS